MKVKMLSTQNGSNNGIVVSTFESGKVYEVSPKLGAAFVKAGMAELTDAPVESEPAPAAKRGRGRPKKGGPAENKAVEPPENKADEGNGEGGPAE